MAEKLCAAIDVPQIFIELYFGITARKNNSEGERVVKTIAFWLFLAALLVSGEAGAGCTSTICTSYRQDGGRVTIIFKTIASGATHVNIRSPYIIKNFSLEKVQQIELPPQGVFSLTKSSGRVTPFSMQACSRGNRFASSSCTGWSNFKAPNSSYGSN